MYLCPEWLEYEKKLGSRPVVKGSYVEIRKAMNDLCSAIAPQFPPHDPALEVYDQKISENVMVRVYRPVNTAPEQNLPIGVYAHGGGNVTASVSAVFEDYNCRYFSLHTPCVIVSVEFRLAPEHIAPAQFEDCLEAYEWVYANASSLNKSVSQPRLFVIGASGGAGLMLAVGLKQIVDGHRDRVCAAVLLAPITMHPEYVPDKYKKRYVAYSENWDGPLINKEAMYGFFAINGGNEMKTDPYVFPALHDRLAELPPTYIATCGADPLRDDGTIIANELARSGVRHKIEDYRGWPHVFWIFPELSITPVFHRKTVEEIRNALAQTA